MVFPVIVPFRMELDGVHPVCAVLTIISLQLLPEMSAIIRERDALEAENERLHAVLELS